MTEPNPENNISPSTPEAIGQLLQENREAQALSIADVADSLKLRIAQVQMIEKGQFSQLSGDAFTRGFIRNYARLLNISDEIIPLLDKALPSAGQAVGKPAHNFQENTHPRKPLPTWVKWLILLIFIGGGFYYWQQQSAKQNKIREDSQSVIAEAPSTKLAAENIKVVPMPEEESVIETLEEEKPEEKKQNTPSTTPNKKKDKEEKIENTKAAPAEVKKSSISAIKDKEALFLSIKYRSYLTVKDDNGDILINQLVQGGSEHQFSGKPPYQIRIGYALGSAVQFNGQNIDLSKYMDGKTATLTVPEKQ